MAGEQSNYDSSALFELTKCNLHPMILVKNVRGTSSNKCKCGSWKQHWRNYGGLMMIGCSNVYCNGAAEVGAHVRKVRGSGNKWYIIPLCRSCNGKNTNLSVWFFTTFVSANVSETCNKPSSFFSW